MEKNIKGMPEYLKEYFTEDEINDIYNEYSKKDYDESIESTTNTREKKSIKEKLDTKFWLKYKAEIKKRKKRVTKENTYNYTEPKRGEERLEEKDVNSDLIKKACSKRLDAFAKYYFPHYLKKPNNQFHEFLYNTLPKTIEQKKGARWAIAASRGYAKSTVISNILPIWCVCYNKKKFIILISDTASQAVDFLADVKNELEVNEALKRDFPNACGKGSVWRSDEIITRNNIKIKALGSGNKIRGRKFGVHRPDLLIGDDIESSEAVRSPVQRDFLRYTWLNKDVLFAGGGDSDAVDIFFIGTILGKDSLLNNLLNPEEYPDWNSEKFKAVLSFSHSPLWDQWGEVYKNRFDENRVETAKKYFEDNKEEMLEGTSVLWPEGESYYDLMIMKLRDPSSFISERQNEPKDPSKILINLNELHFEDFDSFKYRSILNRSRYYGSIDLAVGKNVRRGDYSCIVTLARDPKTGIICIVDVFLKRVPIEDQIDKILELHEEYKYTLFFVESNAFQFVVSDILRKKSRELGYYVPIKDASNFSDKILRIEGIVPFLKDGTIVFDSLQYQNNQMYNLAVSQLCDFSSDGSHAFDDFPDALQMAFEIAKSSRFRLLTKG